MTSAPPEAQPAEVIVGLDVGTTAAKAVAFGLGGGWRRSALREYPLLQPQPGWQVQDPDTVVNAVLAALAEVLTSAAGARVVGVSLSTAMHGLLGLDGDLKPLTPLVTWADARSAPQVDQLRRAGLTRTIYETSGTPVHPMTPLTKLRWFAVNEPELSERVRHWVGLKDYVVLRLTGRLATELSSASGTAMLDVRTGQWDPAAIELAGVDAVQLPVILPTTAVLTIAPALARRLGLPGETPVVMGAGDGPLGNLGTGATSPGVVGLSIGTSGAARMLVPAPVTDPDGRLFCYALTDRHWVAGSAVSNGGVVARWAGTVFGQDLLGDSSGPADGALLALADEVPPGSDGLVMLPYLLAERGPLWGPDLTGAFVGIRHRHTRGHFIRAAVEGVALQLSAIVERLDRVQPVTAVRATGGVFRSQLWREVVAGALGRPIQVVGGAEGTALGAAALGLFALGRAADPFRAVAQLDPAAAATDMASGTGDGGRGETSAVASGGETSAVASAGVGAGLTPTSLTPAADAVVPSPADSEVYARLRGSVSALIEGYQEVARLFADMERR